MNLFGFDFQNRIFNLIKKMNLITAFVSVGKSKELTTYIFHERDFIRIENNILFIKDENRMLKIDEECKRQIIYQMNLI